MSQPGGTCPGFVVDVGQCWRMVYDRNPQADHCSEAAVLDQASISLGGIDGGGCGPVTAITMG